MSQDILADLVTITQTYMRTITTANGYPFDAVVSDDLTDTGRNSVPVIISVALKSMDVAKTNALKKTRDVVLSVEARIHVDRANAHRTALLVVGSLDKAVPTWLPTPPTPASTQIPLATYEFLRGYVMNRPDGVPFIVAGIEISASYVVLSNQRRPI